MSGSATLFFHNRFDSSSDESNRKYKIFLFDILFSKKNTMLRTKRFGLEKTNILHICSYFFLFLHAYIG